MYHLDQLLALLTNEGARELWFWAGRPPVIVSASGRRPLQSPPLSADEVMFLFRKLAGSRELRELRAHGKVQFIHSPPGQSPFLICAKIKSDVLVFYIS